MVKSTKVSVACTVDRGKPGKTPPSKRILPKIKNSGMLRKFGYKVSGTATSRHAAIDQAIKKYGSVVYVLNHLNLIKNYTPKNESWYPILVKDVNYLKQAHKKAKKKKTIK